MVLPTLLLAALAAAPPPAPLPPDDDRCGRSEYVAHYLELNPTSARQGAEITLMPMQARGPGIQREPVDCISEWRVDPALAQLSADHRTLRIAADARPGAQLVIAYKAGGHLVTRPMRVVGRDEIVLTGIRQQSAVEGCALQAPVGELEFREDGMFAVTYRPFETYKDYWGRYQFDPSSGALKMIIEDGNYRPGVVDLEGRAHFDPAGKLVLEGIFLGQPAGAPFSGGSCRYTFG
jgi:hypothetical protein